MARKLQNVIIIGAGPAGLLLALRLAQASIPVHVLDAAPAPSDQPRATHYGPAAVAELARAGVLDAIRAEGFLPESVAWRRAAEAGFEVIARMPQGHIPSPARVTSLPVGRVARILLAAVRKLPSAKVEFGRRVVGARQDASGACVDVEDAEVEGNGAPAAVETLAADYVVGCDGASSTLRRIMFGRDFPGHTWSTWLVSNNVRFPFGAAGHGWDDINFVVHPRSWYMAARISADGNLWRVTYGEDGSLSGEEVLARQPERLREILPGNLGGKECVVEDAAPYRIHQRCAERMAAGRFVLVGDAAHLCNPFGGFGLTSGIADAGGLADCLIGMWRGLVGGEILGRYDEVRRRVYAECVDPLSTANFLRVQMEEPERALEKDPFLKACKEAQDSEEAARRLAEKMRGAAALRHDFTQYYTGGENGEGVVVGA